MKKLFSLIATFAIFFMVSQTTAFAYDNSSANRIEGSNRFSTSAKVCENFTNEKLNNIILANGNAFPDALTGNVLSKKFDAPILLVDGTVKGSSVAINYIKNNLDMNGNIYVLGGKGAIKDELINYLKKIGYKNIERLEGKDRFFTNNSIINKISVEKGTPVMIVNAYGFADGLSASSIASIKGYPMLMSNSDSIPEVIKQQLKNICPSKIYLIGGPGVLKNNIVEELKSMLPNIDASKDIIRISGENRYETSLNTCKYFEGDFSGDSAILASGEGFADALSGSSLASKLGAPVILTDGSNVIEQKKYMDAKNISNIYLIGGKGVISEAAENIIRNINPQLFYVEKAYRANGKNYVTGYFKRRTSDIQELLQYEKKVGYRILSEENGKYYIDNDGYDIKISNRVTLEVSNDVDIKKMSFSEENGLGSVSVEFDNLIYGENHFSKIYKTTIKDGIITNMYEQYRP